ncbi:MAG TPA: replication-associated recombination protein A, partial [Saprospiraceae bacterium]|nr:replication-associated recombination protein A [Saprospiraceae bacterium]
DDYIGQQHIIGPNTALRKSIEQRNIPSFILWGPPGVGKTSLANIIATSLQRPFYMLSAINSGVKDIRESIEKAEAQRFFSQPKPILFIDEIHRFSKAQQDSLLGAVEKGTLVLIGATTENPSFEVISALLSRTQIYKLNALTEQDLIDLIDRAVKTDYYLKKLNIKVEEYDQLIKLSGGDARRLLNVLELIISLKKVDDMQEIVINKEIALEVVSNNLGLYDKTGEGHYDTISAFIKSIRGSDPNAAVYYLAKMLIGGEDPLFICRRMIILAAEDIGLANANALLLANNTFQAVHQIGMPEGRIVISQCAIYLASSPKSNSAYLAIGKAYDMVHKNPHLQIPLSLRNAPTAHMKQIDYGKDYKYSHDFDNSFAFQEFLPSEISKYQFYKSGNNATEQKMVEKIRQFWSGHYEF